MDILNAITLPYCVQGLYILAAATTLFVYAVPQLQSRFLRYGKTAAPILSNHESSNGAHTAEVSGKKHSSSRPSPNICNACLDYLATLQVPHAYFGHFYIISLASSLFWGYQILYHGRAITALIDHMAPSPGPSQTRDQILIGWLLVFIQGSRRLYESYFISKKSSSTMWFVHWLLGMVFYSNLGIAVWAEGTVTILSQTPIRLSKIRPLDKPPSLKTMIAIPLFLLSSGLQYDCHVYLASLRKYTLPNSGLFKHIICPHYFAECLIYVALAIATAPPGYLLNRTVLSALVFVVSNLGITARINKEWYEEKFGTESIKGRWKMIPLIY